MKEFEERLQTYSTNGNTAFYTLLDKLATKSIDLDVFCWNGRGRKFWESLGFKELAIIMRKQENVE